MDAYNDFDNPDVVSEKDFDGIKIDGDKLIFTIPQSSVMHIEVEI
jgi:alpha-L-arabinofuranosidase